MHLLEHKIKKQKYSTTLIHRLTNIHMPTHEIKYIQTHTLAHMHILSHGYSYSNTPTHTPTHVYINTHTHKHIYKHSYTLTINTH